MKTFSKYLSATGVVALLAVPVIAMGSAVHAEGFRVRTGDLSQPERAANFRHDVEAAGNALCSDYAMDAAFTENVRTCKAAVREEAVAQLSPSQREHLFAAERTLTLASAR